MTSAIERLYAEIYENPDDDQPRRVLADALIAVDDPRGELILYQLERTKDYQSRAMRLIQAHGLSWLGALRGIAIPLGYERGFLASCSVIADNAATCLEWATVHTIEVATREFVLHPEMRSLHELWLGSAARLLEQLANRSRALLAPLTIHVTYVPVLHGVLVRQLRRGLGRSLVIDRVPEVRAAELRVLGASSRTVLDLRIFVPPPGADPAHYDDVDE